MNPVTDPTPHPPSEPQPTASPRDADPPNPAPLPPVPTEERDLCLWASDALAEGRIQEALAAWDRAGKPGQAASAVQTTLALLEAEHDAWEAVRNRASAALADDPSNPLAGGLMALAAWKLGDFATAADRFDRHGLFAAFPLVRLFVWTFATDVRTHPGRYPWPGADAEPSAESEGDEENQTNLPGADRETKVLPPLWKRLLRGGGLGSDSAARALVTEGDEALGRGHLKTALGYFLAAARTDPENWMARMAVGLCRLELGDYDRAASELAQLLSEKPDVPNLASAAAWALLHQGDCHRALEVLATLTPAGPDDWGMHYIAAQCFKELEQPDHADRLLREALGPFFLDTWEQFVLPLYHRVRAALQLQADRAAMQSTAEGGNGI